MTSPTRHFGKWLTNPMAIFIDSYCRLGRNDTYTTIECSPLMHEIQLSTHTPPGGISFKRKGKQRRNELIFEKREGVGVCVSFLRVLSSNAEQSIYVTMPSERRISGWEKTAINLQKSSQKGCMCTYFSRFSRSNSSMMIRTTSLSVLFE